MEEKGLKGALEESRDAREAEENLQIPKQKYTSSVPRRMTSKTLCRLLGTELDV